MANEALRKELESTLGPVKWEDLRKHMARDVIILVSEQLHILDAAVKVAENDQYQVAAWIADGILTKPNAQQLALWETNLELPFLSIVVQPFILIQLLN
jgi:hypothetical protein